MKKLWGWGVWWVAIWGIFFGMGIKNLDPDFGWHIRTGKWIMDQKRVPTTDPFSYTMPTYPFVDHEWLTNLGMYLGYQRFGYNFLAGIFATLATVTLWVAGMGGLRFWTLLPIGFGLEALMNRSGVRPQIEDWLLLMILIVWFDKRKFWLKTMWLFPILMVVWVNLHGGFALGIILGGLIMFLAWIQEKKINYREALTGLVGIVATLVNPYGWRVWWEVWMQMSDSGLRKYIAEWQPFYNNVEFGYWLLAALVGALGWRYRVTYSWSMIGAAAVTFVAGLSSLRHMALFVVVAILFAAKGLEKFYEEIKISPTKIKRGKNMLVMFGGISLVVVTFSILKNYGYLKNYNPVSVYPNKAVDFLKKNPFEGNLFAPYEWGGYLIKEYPEKKVFIDGRMPSWRRSEEVVGESNWAFVDYLTVAYKGEYTESFKKFDIKRVLLSNHEIKKTSEWWLILGNFVFNYDENDKNNNSQLRDSLENDGWRRIYTDDSTIILEK